MELDEDRDADSDSPITATNTESTSELLARLQNAVCSSPVKIYVGRNTNIRPALIEQDIRCEVSPQYFAKCFDKDSPFARFKEADEEDRSFTFADYTPDTVKVFLYWLTYRRIPAMSKLDTGAFMLGSEYQLLLARCWAFGEDKEIPRMQNAVMKAFIASLRQVEMTVDVLQKVLKFAMRESRLRVAVLEEALYLEADGGELLEGLDVKGVFGFGYDMSRAKTAIDKRRGRRGRAAEYLVKV
ncbi:hypothetical protein LTR85_007221 [Meristemomyces frigidus]|nr:hypothetical protein LTR85_007221 [Meristemomyces frigidus]